MNPGKEASGPSDRPIHVVTGAFGYSGRHIAGRLLERGMEVRTLTSRPQSASPFGTAVPAYPLSFDDQPKLTDALRGTAVLYNTYWVRFDAAGFRQDTAVENTLRLFRAAKEAGVGRVVHVSITNPSPESSLPYFRRKAELEQALIDSGMSYAILRSAVLFGDGDVLINNIAWLLRRIPFFLLFGDGQYRLRPIFVGDLAKLAVEVGARSDCTIIDAVGPESFSYRELVEQIGIAIGRRRPLICAPSALAYGVGRIVGTMTRDTVVTRDEIAGLMQGLLDTDSRATGDTRLTEWARQHADSLGLRYASEVARRRG